SGLAMNNPGWSRYHLLPQLGLALLVCAGLPRWQGSLFALDPAGKLSDQQGQALTLLVALLFFSQLPRALIAAPSYDPGQSRALRQIEDMDARCRSHHIGADAAYEALTPIHVPGAGDGENGWWMLHGSPQPREVSVEEARRLLETSDHSVD